MLFASLFWCYITLTDIVYHEAMRIELHEMTNIMVYFPWQYRVMQHALMLPLLLVCYAVALRLGWTPPARRIPLQLALALGFALMMFWMMLIGGIILHVLLGWHADPFGIFTAGDWAVWVSSTATALLAYGFGLSLLSGVVVYRRYHELQLHTSELRRDWAGARLAALRTQLSPHTLFNVLHTIQARISGAPEVAQTLIASLGDLLRGLLEAGEHDYARLRAELQFVELYLGLQVGRFADRLTVQVQNGAEVPAVWVPSLILQPLVENAVVHGLADHNGAVRIDVSWDLSPYRLQLRVVNTVGPGRRSGTGGFGLRNVRERLAVQFGERAVLSSAPGADSTWVATLHLPVLREYRSDQVPSRRQPP
ncbi:MAG: histidine kinase [Gammaproteobacteria bacterium]|nr:histidine kinase [Gammaproteobacteria bacterium]